MMLLTLTVLALCLAAFGLVRSSKRSKLPLPPGPRGLPIIGNLFDIPKCKEWLAYLKWAKEFNSDVISVNVLGQHIVVLNSAQAASDVMDKRGSNFSDRPSVPMVTEILGWKFSFLLMNYGAPWRERRRMFHQFFYPGSKHRPTTLENARELVPNLVKAPERYDDGFRLFAGTIILQLVYGIKPKGENDRLIRLAEEASSTGTRATVPGVFMVNLFPALMYVPEWAGAKFKTYGKKWRHLTTDLVRVPFAMVQEALANGSAKPSFVTSLLESMPTEENQKIAETAGVAYAAGADTLVTTLSTFLLAMTLYPECQKRAQAEIDSVVGSERLPTHDDMPHMPYVTCLVKESFRWIPALHLGVAHTSTSDAEYNGYFIPAGSIIMGNSGAILHDPTVFVEPTVFKPERYLESPALLSSVTNSVVFGYGRRSCPGADFAFDALWIALATILAACKIDRALDEEGTPITPTRDYIEGLVSFPTPFQCDIKYRSEEARHLVAQ